MQNLNRFLLATLDENYRRLAGNARELQLALGTMGRAYSVCTTCSYEDSKDQVWFTHDLVYPPRANKHSPRSVRHYFSRLLKESVERYDQHRGWCMRCQGSRLLGPEGRSFTTPSVLMINAAIHTTEANSSGQHLVFFQERLASLCTMINSTATKVKIFNYTYSDRFTTSPCMSSSALLPTLLHQRHSSRTLSRWSTSHL